MKLLEELTHLELGKNARAFPLSEYRCVDECEDLDDNCWCQKYYEGHKGEEHILEVWKDPTYRNINWNDRPGVSLEEGVIWWHQAYKPGKLQDVSAGEACCVDLQGFTFTTTDRGIRREKPSIEDLISNTSRVWITPSILCYKCGQHIYLTDDVTLC